MGQGGARGGVGWGKAGRGCTLEGAGGIRELSSHLQIFHARGRRWPAPCGRTEGQGSRFPQPARRTTTCLSTYSPLLLLRGTRHATLRLPSSPPRGRPSLRRPTLTPEPSTGIIFDRTRRARENNSNNECALRCGGPLHGGATAGLAEGLARVLHAVVHAAARFTPLPALLPDSIVWTLFRPAAFCGAVPCLQRLQCLVAAVQCMQVHSANERP